MSANKRLWLPPGKQVHVEKELHRHQKWVHLLGYSVPQLRSSAPDRCLYNIESLRWACQHGTKDLAWAFVDGGREPDKSLPNADFIPNTTSNVMSNQRVTSMPGDKFACDTCSLSQTCKLFKVGSVCTLPESETKSIADKIKSRNTNDILDALADMAAAQANRAQSGMAFEVDFGLDPAVDKTIKSAFEMTERLAKLNDPSLRASISLQKIQRVGEIPQVPKQALPDPAEAVRNAIAYYQAQGFSPTEITQSMIKEYVKNLSAPQEIEPPKPAEDADELLEGELLDETIPAT